MDAGRRWLRSRGFVDEQIVDTSATKPWDLEAADGDKKYYVEAKASRSAWSEEFTVFVTRNEVLHAQRNPDTCALVLATSCTLDRRSDGLLVATPHKTMVVFPWLPSGESLVAVAYKHGAGLLVANALL